MTRKGISPLVAVIMLIAFTLIVAGILAGWATRFAETQRETITLCANARILMSRGTYDPGTETLKIVLYNYGSADLKLTGILTYPDLDIRTMKDAFEITAGDTQVFTIENVTSELREIEVRVDECPGTTDGLSALEIDGL